MMSPCGWSGAFLALNALALALYFFPDAFFSHRQVSWDVTTSSPSSSSFSSHYASNGPKSKPGVHSKTPKNSWKKPPSKSRDEPRPPPAQEIPGNSSEMWDMHHPPVHGAMPKLILSRQGEQQQYLFKLSCRFKHSVMNRHWLTKGYNAIIATALDEILLGRGDPRGHGKIIPVNQLISSNTKDEKAWQNVRSQCLWKAGNMEFVAGVLLQYGKHIKDRKNSNCQIFRDHAEDSAKQWILDMLIGQADRYCNHNVFVNTISGRQVFLDFDDGSYFDDRTCSAKEYLTLTNPFFTKGSGVDKRETFCVVSKIGEHLTAGFPTEEKIRDLLQQKLLNDEWFTVFLPFHYFQSGWMEEHSKHLCKDQSIRCKISRGFGTFEGVGSACVSDFVQSYETSPVNELLIAAISDIYARRSSHLYGKLHRARHPRCSS